MRLGWASSRFAVPTQFGICCTLQLPANSHIRAHGQRMPVVTLRWTQGQCLAHICFVASCPSSALYLAPGSARICYGSAAAALQTMRWLSAQPLSTRAQMQAKVALESCCANCPTFAGCCTCFTPASAAVTPLCAVPERRASFAVPPTALRALCTSRWQPTGTRNATCDCAGMVVQRIARMRQQ